jgi:hypothetical protein
MKIKFLLLTVLLSTLLFSCASTKQNQSSPDNYYDNVTTAQTPSDTEEHKIDYNSVEKDSIVNIKEKKNAFQDFFSFGNKDDFIQYDKSTLFTKGISGLKEKQATLVINTENYNAGFGSSYMAAYYIVTFDEAAREKVINSINNYLEDFENKRLNRKGKNTYQAYGKMPMHLDWGTLPNSTPNNGKGHGYCGYEFEKGSPYFTISNFPFINDHYEVVKGSTTRESMALKFYFTKSQAKQLAAFLTNDVIYKALNEAKVIYIPTQADEY